MDETQSSLRAAICELYRVFSRYKLDALTGCPHCTSDEEGVYLASKLLRELTAADLERYSWKAMTTCGSVDDFKHFLPRIFELVVSGELTRLSDVEVSFGKLEYGDWRYWPAKERRAIEDFLHALWRHLLGTYPFVVEVDSCLCGIGCAVSDLSEYLDAWSANESLAAARHLADLVDANQLSQRLRPGMRNAFWHDRAAQAEQTWEWLMRPERKVQLERAFFAVADDADVAAQLSDALQMLDMLQQVAAATRREP